MKKMVALIGAGLLALTACGGGGSNATDKPESGQNNSAGSQTPPTTPGSSDGSLNVGDTYSGKVSTEKIVSYTHEDTQELADKPAGRVDYFVIQTCANAGQDPVSPSGETWKLADTEGGFYESAYIGNNYMPKPGYPSGDIVLKPGQCAKGTLAFDVPIGVKLDRVVYNSEWSGTAEWKVVEPKPTPKPTFTITNTKKLNTNLVSLTPLEYRPNVTQNGGNRIDGFLVKACANSTITLTFGRWGATIDGKEVDASGYDFLKPEYPNGEEFKKGQCVSGWMFLEMSKADSKVAALDFDNEEGITARWSIKQQ
jgi:hypothetical protein